MSTETAPDDAPLASSAFRLYGLRLHRFLTRRLASPQDADDLSQEVFMRLSRLDRPDLVRKPQAYLFRVASHVVSEFRLRNAREREHVTYDSQVIEQLAEASPNEPGDELAERLNLQAQLERALMQLPKAQRAVLLLVKRDGLSHKEAARKTGLHVRTVERYVMEAVSKMLTQEWDR